MYYVDTNLDILDQQRIIKEEQKDLVDRFCCKYRRKRH
jgi:hypothetical protein